MIDWSRTHANTTRYLIQKLRPCSYRELYPNVVHHNGNGEYAQTTDPIEKFRQRYAEHDHPDTLFINGGYIAMRRWFPQFDQNQLALLPPPPETHITIAGDCIVAYDAGYEYAQREPHMKDHFFDAHSRQRYERRRRALIVESHVKHFFSAVYPAFFRPPSNQGQYTQSAPEDFFLTFNGLTIPVDIKTPSYKDEEGNQYTCVRDPKAQNIYIVADWQSDQRTVMTGMYGGGWIKRIGIDNNNLFHVSDNHSWSIECLFVLLNMAQIHQEPSYSAIVKQMRSIATTQEAPR